MRDPSHKPRACFATFDRDEHQCLFKYWLGVRSRKTLQGSQEDSGPKLYLTMKPENQKDNYTKFRLAKECKKKKKKKSSLNGPPAKWLKAEPQAILEGYPNL